MRRNPSGHLRAWASPILALGFCLACCAAPAAPGTLRTLDGRDFPGDILVEPGGFKVSAPDQSGPHIELARVALVKIDVPKDQGDPIARAKLSGNGLLGDYFDQMDLAGRVVHRRDDRINFHWGDGAPMPGMPSDKFSVRWTGELRVPLDGLYTFILQCDDGARLWLDDQRLFDEWKSHHGEELRAQRTLSAGRKYQFKMEYFERDNTALARLSWEAPGLPRGVIPRQCFSTTSPLATNAPPPSEHGYALPTRPGVLLCDGTFLTWNVRSLDGTTLRLGGPKEFAVPVSEVARIHFSELPPEACAQLRGARPGVLVAGREFVDGEVKSIADQRVRISSVLFGLRTFEGNDRAAAVVFREVQPGPCRYELRLRNGSLLRADALECGQQHLLLRDGLLRGLRIEVWELEELRAAARTKGR